MKIVNHTPNLSFPRKRESSVFLFCPFIRVTPQDFVSTDDRTSLTQQLIGNPLDQTPFFLGVGRNAFPGYALRPRAHGRKKLPGLPNGDPDRLPGRFDVHKKPRAFLVALALEHPDASPQR